MPKHACRLRGIAEFRRGHNAAARRRFLTTKIQPGIKALAKARVAKFAEKPLKPRSRARELPQTAGTKFRIMRPLCRRGGGNGAFPRSWKARKHPGSPGGRVPRAYHARKKRLANDAPPEGAGGGGVEQPLRPGVGQIRRGVASPARGKNRSRRLMFGHFRWGTRNAPGRMKHSCGCGVQMGKASRYASASGEKWERGKERGEKEREEEYGKFEKRAPADFSSNKWMLIKAERERNGRPRGSV